MLPNLRKFIVGRGVIVRGLKRSMPRLAWGGACAGLLAMAVAAGLACAAWSRAGDRVASALATSEPAPVVQPLQRPPVPFDFSNHLAAGQPDSVILQALQGSAQAAHVAVGSVQVQEHRLPQENALGHARISVEWHGRYQDIKKALADVLDRLPGVSVERLALSRAAGPEATVDAVVSMSAWAAPAVPASGAAP